MKIATVSLNQAWEDKKANVTLCERYISQASTKSVDLIIFPEMTLTSFSTNISKISEDAMSSKTIKQFTTLAKKYEIAVLFGLVIQDGEKAFNMAIFLNSDGQILGKYAKIHPFSFSGEDRYFKAGKKLSVVNYVDLNIG